MGHHTIDAQLVKIVQDNIDRSTVGPYLWSTRLSERPPNSYQLLARWLVCIALQLKRLLQILKNPNRFMWTRTCSSNQTPPPRDR